MNNQNEKTKFSSKINEKSEEFRLLVEKFNKMDNPIERYIKRQEMKEIKEWLAQFNVDIEIP